MAGSFYESNGFHLNVDGQLAFRVQLLLHLARRAGKPIQFSFSLPLQLSFYFPFIF